MNGAGKREMKKALEALKRGDDRGYELHKGSAEKMKGECIDCGKPAVVDGLCAVCSTLPRF